MGASDSQKTPTSSESYADCTENKYSKNDLQVIGITRFSYNCSGGYKIGHTTSQERLDYLFNPARIDERLTLFENVTLPCICGQTDRNFTQIVITSQHIPEHYLERLAKLLDGIPNIALVLREPENHRVAMRKVINQFIDPNSCATVQFRLDDDDAVALDFVERLRNHYCNAQPYLDKTGRCAVDFVNGIELFTRDDHITARRVERHSLGVGLGIYLKTGRHGSLFNFAHHRVAEFMNVISDDTPDMFVRSHNNFNDSLYARNSLTPQFELSDDLFNTLKTRFDVKVKPLR